MEICFAGNEQCHSTLHLTCVSCLVYMKLEFLFVLFPTTEISQKIQRYQIHYIHMEIHTAGMAVKAVSKSGGIIFLHGFSHYFISRVNLISKFSIISSLYTYLLRIVLQTQKIITLYAISSFKITVTFVCIYLQSRL